MSSGKLLQTNNLSTASLILRIVDLCSKGLWTARLQQAKIRPASLLDRSKCMPQPGSCIEAEFASGYLDNLFKSC